MSPKTRLLAFFLVVQFYIGCAHSVGPDAPEIELETKNVPDYLYLRNTYFFLDDSYRENYGRFDAQLSHLAASDPIEESSLSVYIAEAGFYTNPDAIRAWATLTATASDTLNSVIPGQAQLGYFIRLDRSEYTLEPNLGFFRMAEPVPNDRVLAVSYATVNGIVYGENLDASKNIILKLIRDRNSRPSNEIWNLSWRHVYSLGDTNISPEGFDIKIWSNPAVGPAEEFDAVTGKRWTQIFGLDFTDRNGVLGNPDGSVDMQTGAVDLVNGELHFPDLRPFDPEGYVVGGVTFNHLAEDKRTPAIYDTTVQTFIQKESKFSIEISARKGS